MRAPVWNLGMDWGGWVGKGPFRPPPRKGTVQNARPDRDDRNARPDRDGQNARFHQGPSDPVVLRVFDFDVVKTNDLLGTLEIPLFKLKDGETYHQWCEIILYIIYYIYIIYI